MGGEEDFWGDFAGGEGMRGRVEEEERSGWTKTGPSCSTLPRWKEQGAAAAMP